MTMNEKDRNNDSDDPTNTRVYSLFSQSRYELKSRRASSFRKYAGADITKWNSSGRATCEVNIH